MQDCKYGDQFERILDKLDKTDDTLNKINETLTRNTVSLEQHMQRTALLEQTLLPINKVYVWGSVSIKIIGFIGVIVAIVSSIIKYL